MPIRSALQVSQIEDLIVTHPMIPCRQKLMFYKAAHLVRQIIVKKKKVEDHRLAIIMEWESLAAIYNVPLELFPGALGERYPIHGYGLRVSGDGRDS